LRRLAYLAIEQISGLRVLLLAFETSVRDGTIALRRDGVLLEERLLEQGGRRHAQTLVAEIDALLKSHACRPAQLDAVAVSSGPGSFTGLRVGVVSAKTLAYATGARLAAVDTLAAVAEQTPGRPPVLHVIADAQRADIHVATYRFSEERGDEYRRDGEIEIVAAAVWCGQRVAGDVVSGPGVEKVASLLTGRVHLPPHENRIPRAATIALLGERRIASGIVDDAWTTEPVYVRKSAAEEKWDAERGS
jgi:tRNA threonylcarbamoyladenosine biosynthesis protein TsaB